MRASKLFFLFCFLFVLTRTQAQFFTKTTNSIPRLEGQINPFLPNLVRHVAKQLHFNAMKSELEAIELRGQYLATNGKAERESEPSGKQRLIYDENLIM
ncbi:uncharacterized protein CEXT_678211 [Caerostris extrusa]|uniref:Uncharacterized protein n=1 Tax=Caerostris extrusa TaxID=172846 RepID=A0AAV4T800_CAEEX|nr:uncharacterized protein CEXT_678211 [Caerostris extrusa]